ncbi:hypothetical protein E2C01_086595 [Portunus trituberculatus]|uniref:Uncharacterized protein n=1 Tax=Portunus trituberculatus TaxID=210409 RepID=A0A5B7J468_PORTR|nr:hypothetical protein [Portunus trituberculatus]
MAIGRLYEARRRGGRAEDGRVKRGRRECCVGDVGETSEHQRGFVGRAGRVGGGADKLWMCGEEGGEDWSVMKYGT